MVDEELGRWVEVRFVCGCWCAGAVKSTVQCLGCVNYLSFFDCGRGRCFFHFLSRVSSTLFVLFASVNLLSCLRAVDFSLFVFQRFFRCFVLSIVCLITLSLLRRASGSSLPFHLHRLPRFPPPISCSPTPSPHRRATAYCTNVFSSKV